MKIKTVKLKNCKGVKSFCAIMNPTVQMIDGPNGAGKSSIVEGIMSSLVKAADRSDLLSKWAETGKCELAMDNGTVVSLTYGKNKSPKLTIKEGRTTLKKPQEVLSSFRGPLSTLDPVAIMKADHIELTRQLMGSEYLSRLSEIESLLLEKKQQRSVLKEGLQDAVHPEPVEPVERPDIETLSQKCVAESSVREKRNRLSAEIAQLEKMLEEKQAELKSLPEADDSVQEKFQQGLKQQEQYERYQRYLEFQKRNAEEYARLEAVEDEVLDLRERLKSHKESASLPRGFSITESGLTWNDTPLTSLSEAERIRASFELCTQLNGKLRFFAIKEGSALTTRMLSEIAKLSSEYDYQVLVEIAGKAPIEPGVWHIVDGESVDVDRLKAAIANEPCSRDLEKLIVGDF